MSEDDLVQAPKLSLLDAESGRLTEVRLRSRVTGADAGCTCEAEAGVLGGSFVENGALSTVEEKV